MRCCTATKEGSRKMCVCGVNFKMCFPPHGHMASSVREGCWGWGPVFEVCHCLHRWQHKFNTLSENRNSAGCLIAYSSLSLSLSLSRLPILLYLSVALLHSLCLLDLPVSTHTTEWGQRGVGKRETQWWWQRRRWGTNGPLLFWHVYGVHTTHTRRHTTAGTGNILDTVFKFN